MSRKASLTYFPALDGLRGLAVMLVIAFHFGILDFGWAGVGMFFVLSGFLITRLLLDTKPLGFGKYIGRFYWRRALRILPLYFGFLLLIGVFFAATGSPTWFSKHLPFLASFSYNFYIAAFRSGSEALFHPLWSISAEEQFYILWPLLVFLFNRKVLSWAAILLVLAAPIVRFWEIGWIESGGIGEQAPVWQGLYYLPMGHVDAFALGALVAILPAGPWTKKPIPWAIGMSLPVLLVVLVSIGAYLFGFNEDFPRAFGFDVTETEFYWPVWAYSFVYFAFAGLLIAVLCTKSSFIIRRIAEWGPARFVGKISYGMYIFHWPILLGLMKIWPLDYDQPLILLIQWKLYMLFVLATAWLSHRYFEKWFLSKKELLFNA